MTFQSLRGEVAALLVLLSTTVLADGVTINSDGAAPQRADGHAPFGVMGDHMHRKGQWMMTYRYMMMDMSGNRVGENRISADDIVTTIPNRFFGARGQPPTLRVVPTEMTTEMHMFGGMYAPTEWLTLMLMSSYVEKQMDHVTYRGGAGTNVLGTFTTESDGIGDTRLSGLFKLYDDSFHHAHVSFGGSIPTGSTNETDTILTPMGATPTPRLPYAMQIGSGTFDLLTGIDYNGRSDRIGWGARYVGTIRAGKDRGYS